MEELPLKQHKHINPFARDIIQRYLLFIIGLFFSAMGVAITK